MKPAATVATLFLSIVAALHLLRLILQLPIAIGGSQVPMWPSAVAVIGLGLLAVWLWREQKG